MKSFLEKLRGKSPTSRSQIAFGSATVFAGLVAIIWASTLPARFEELPLVVGEQVNEATAEDSFFTTLFDEANSQLGGAQEAVQEEATPRADMQTEEENLEDWRSSFEEATSTDTVESDARIILIATSTKQSGE